VRDSEDLPTSALLLARPRSPHIAVHRMHAPRPPVPSLRKCLRRDARTFLLRPSAWVASFERTRLLCKDLPTSALLLARPHSPHVAVHRSACTAPSSTIPAQHTASRRPHVLVTSIPLSHLFGKAPPPFFTALPTANRSPDAHAPARPCCRSPLRMHRAFVYHSCTTYRFTAPARSCYVHPRGSHRLREREAPPYWCRLAGRIRRLAAHVQVHVDPTTYSQLLPSLLPPPSLVISQNFDPKHRLERPPRTSLSWRRASSGPAGRNAAQTPSPRTSPSWRHL
jgi:hypothetical protein